MYLRICIYLLYFFKYIFLNESNQTIEKNVKFSGGFINRRIWRAPRA